MWNCRKRDTNKDASGDSRRDDDAIALLQLISSEIDREIENTSNRQANAVTRASIILAAAGITAFSTTHSSLWLSIVPVFLSFTSALLSLAGIRYWKSKSVQLTQGRIAKYIKSDIKSVQWRLMDDKFRELQAARNDLDKKTKFLRWAVASLVLAWIVSGVVRFIVQPYLTGVGY